MGCTKAMLRGKFITIQAFLKEEENHLLPPKSLRKRRTNKS